MSHEPFPAFSDWKVDFDSSVVDAYAARLNAARATATPEAQKRALRVATRYAAVDTGAIEGLYTTDRGFTRTIAIQTEFWQQALDQRGSQVRRSIEDALAGYDYVLDAVTGKVQITQTWIRELHAVITAHQETYVVHVPIGGELRTELRSLPHGEYKTDPNYPVDSATGRLFHCALPEQTDAEMMRLVDEFRSDSFQQAHPIVQAAYAHYAYVCVHPFADGNGRVARALASVFLYRNPGVPLVVFADQRGMYYDALERADAGLPTKFVQFISECVIGTVELVIGGLEEPSEDTDVVQRINQALSTGMDQRLVTMAMRLSGLARQTLKEEVDKLQLPKALNAMVTGPHAHETSTGVPDGYRTVQSTGVWAAVWLPSGYRKIVFEVTAQDDDLTRPQLIIAGDAGTPSLEVWSREIGTTVAMTLDIKLHNWARSAARRFVEFIEEGLRSEGGETA